MGAKVRGLTWAAAAAALLALAACGGGGSAAKTTTTAAPSRSTTTTPSSSTSTSAGSDPLTTGLWTIDLDNPNGTHDQPLLPGPHADGSRGGATITLKDGTYTVRSVGQAITVPNDRDQCTLPPGTVVMTFTPSGPGTYKGQSQFYNDQSCKPTYLVDMSLTTVPTAPGVPLQISFRETPPNTGYRGILTEER